MKTDRLIIGAGLYGLYSALYCGKRGLKVTVLEVENSAFKRATYINQARVHMGYHYPRSLFTAIKSAGYFKRFVEEYDFCIRKNFEQIYATSSNYSWTQAPEFKDFCKAAGIRCDEISADQYFMPGMCDGAFLTEEYTYDANVLKVYLLDEIAKCSNIQIIYNANIDNIEKSTDAYLVHYNDECVESPFVLNATYASVNQIIKLVYPEDVFKIKYELCEIILCETSEKLKNIGFTVMDGPFFSIMPFGLTGLHSLTAVSFTPHVTSFEDTPTFKCQGTHCTSMRLSNCNACKNRPDSAWEYMSHLVNKYLKPEYAYTYKESLFSMKPILKSSEIDDSRPTAIKVHSGGKGSSEPIFISVLSGKINTVYDLEEYLI